MTPESYLHAIAVGVLIGAPLIAGAVAIRHLLVPGWGGALARLAEAVIAISLLLVVAELLGVVGWLQRWPLVAATAAVGFAACAIGRRCPPLTSPEVPPRAIRGSRLSLAVAIPVAGIVIAQWAGFTLQSMHRGLLNIDSLWYHLPFAARFAQTHSITALHFTMTEPLSPASSLHAQLEAAIGVPTFYPANSSLLHAAGMVLVGNDFASTLLNFAFMALGLLAAWCVGRPFGAAPETLIAGSLLLAVPAMITTQPGAATNDIVVFAFFLSAAALLANGGLVAHGPISLAGLAAGFAVGTKLNMLAPIGLLTLLLVASVRGRRLATMATWLGAMSITGGYWYLRNLADAGNPIPYLNLSLGPLSLPRPNLPLTNHYAYSAIRYATDTSVWRNVFRPLLRQQFGPGWYVLLLLCVAGMVLAIARGPRVPRLLGVTGLGSLVIFPFTPLTGAGPPGDPYTFAFTLRYIVPALALGAILLVSLLGRRARLIAVAGLVVLFINIEAADIWPSTITYQGFTIAGALVFALTALRLSAFRGRVATWGVAAATCLIAGGVGLHEAGVYRTGRYADLAQPLVPEYAWAARQRHARIALAGFFTQYPFYGRDQSNHVQVLGREGAHGAYFPLHSCVAWRNALLVGRYRYVVTAPESTPAVPAVVLRQLGARVQEPPEAAWTRSIPGTVEIMRTVGNVSLFRVGTTAGKLGC